MFELHENVLFLVLDIPPCVQSLRIFELQSIVEWAIKFLSQKWICLFKLNFFSPESDSTGANFSTWGLKVSWTWIQTPNKTMLPKIKNIYFYLLASSLSIFINSVRRLNCFISDWRQAAYEVCTPSLLLLYWEAWLISQKK